MADLVAVIADNKIIKEKRLKKPFDHGNGISRVFNVEETTVETNAKGTHGWMPPEVIKVIEKKEKGRFKRKSDVHVASMIAFYVLTEGEHPFGPLLERMKNILDNNQK